MRLACLALLTLLPLAAQTDPAALLETKTLEHLRALDSRLDGVLGVAAIDLKTGRTFSLHGDVETVQASLIKIPILVTAYQLLSTGALKLDQTVTLTDKDKIGGSGNLQFELDKGPVTISFDDLLTRMIRDSDNLATNQVIALVRIDRVNALMTRLGFPHTRLRRVMMDGEAARRDEDNSSTPLEMARLVELIYRGKAVSPQASAQMIERLKQVRAEFQAALPPGVAVASKPGDLPGVHTEAGIVYLEGRPYVLSIMSSLLAGSANPIRDVVEIVHSHFARLAASNRFGHRVAEPIF